MNYGEWSKSLELDRTFGSKLVGCGTCCKIEPYEKNEESESLRCPAHLGGMMGFEVDRTVSNLIELERDEKMAQTL